MPLNCDPEAMDRLITCMQREADEKGFSLLLLDVDESRPNRDCSVVLPYAVREDHAQPFHVANWKIAITPHQPPRRRSEVAP